MKFLSLEVPVYLYKFIINPCLKYYCHVCVHTLSCYLDIIDKLQTQICGTVGPSLAAFLDPFAYFRNLASLILFCRHYFDRFSCELAELVPSPHSCDRSTHCCYRSHDFSLITFRWNNDVNVNIFFPCMARLWNSLPAECFPLNTFFSHNLKVES